jgi:hypothetical protein
MFQGRPIKNKFSYFILKDGIEYEIPSDLIRGFWVQIFRKSLRKKGQTTVPAIARNLITVLEPLAMLEKEEEN